jgi:hypothetical protein
MALHQFQGLVEALEATKETGHLRRQLEDPRPWRHKQYKGLNKVGVASVLATRSAHGDFADYHERFEHDTKLTCPGRVPGGA